MTNIKKLLASTAVSAALLGGASLALAGAANADTITYGTGTHSYTWTTGGTHTLVCHGTGGATSQTTIQGPGTASVTCS